MRQTEIVKRAFRLTFRYPVLWIFGILIALTTGGGAGGGSNYSFGGNGDGGGVPQVPGLSGLSPGAWIGIVLFCCFVLLVVIVVTVILQYVARTALYRMVDHIEENGAKPTWRQGFHLGWSSRAFRLFLLELIVGLAVAIAAIVLLVAAASPLLLLLIDNTASRAVGIGLTIAFVLFVLLILLVVCAALSVLKQFWSREIVLANRSIGEAFACGYRLVRDRVKDVGLMWLLLLAIGIGWSLLMIPIVLVVILAGVGLGAAMGFGVYGITHSIPWGVVAGLPVFLAIVIVPMTFLQGLYTVFDSSAWTLAYREVLHGSAQPEGLPAATPA